MDRKCRNIGVSFLSMTLFLTQVALAASSLDKKAHSQMGEFEILDDPVKRQEGVPVGWIQEVASRIWLTHLAGSPLTLPVYGNGCISNLHSISEIRKQLAALHIEKIATSMLANLNGILVWPHRCSPVEMTFLSNPEKRVELVILQQQDFAGFLQRLISALKEGFPRAAMVARKQADDLRMAYNAMDPIPFPSHRPLVGYPVFESSGSGYWRTQYEKLAKSGLAQGNYSIRESELFVRLTFDLSPEAPEGVK